MREKCALVMWEKTRVYQMIDLHLYSLLINTNNAMINFNALASCNQSYFEIHMFRSDGIKPLSLNYSGEFHYN